MIARIEFVDRDEVIAATREAENESEIAKLVRQLMRAREELELSEANLEAIEESLAGKKN
jgi:hypothetical protein